MAQIEGQTHGVRLHAGAVICAVMGKAQFIEQFAP